MADCVLLREGLLRPERHGSQSGSGRYAIQQTDRPSNSGGLCGGKEERHEGALGVFGPMHKGNAGVSGPR